MGGLHSSKYMSIRRERLIPKPVRIAVVKVLGIFDLIGTLLYKRLVDIDLV